MSSNQDTITAAYDSACELAKGFFWQWRNMVKELEIKIAQKDRQLEKHRVICGVAPLNECNLEWRQMVDELREQLKVKDKELQLTLQQLNIALKGKRPFTFGNEVTEGQAKRIKELEEKCNALANFKTFVHERLDAAGVPKEFPEGQHTKEGCRIGDRLDWLLQDQTRLDALERLIKNCPHTEFYFTDDADEEKPVGFLIVTAGCETITSVAPTLREALDKEVELQKLFVTSA